MQRYYITPMLDENLLVYDEADTDAEYFYLHDGLGTVRQILDASQNVENQYDYEGFGTSLSSTESIYNRFRYTGREYDKETESDPTAGGGAGTNDGLYYYRARTYDSTIGSFTSRDPIPEEDLYTYCYQNPINWFDANGKKPEPKYIIYKGEKYRVIPRGKSRTYHNKIRNLPQGKVWTSNGFEQYPIEKPGCGFIYFKSWKLEGNSPFYKQFYWGHLVQIGFDPGLCKGCDCEKIRFIQIAQGFYFNSDGVQLTNVGSVDKRTVTDKYKFVDTSYQKTLHYENSTIGSCTKNKTAWMTDTPGMMDSSGFGTNLFLGSISSGDISHMVYNFETCAVCADKGNNKIFGCINWGFIIFRRSDEEWMSKFASDDIYRGLYVSNIDTYKTSTPSTDFYDAIKHKNATVK